MHFYSRNEITDENIEELAKQGNLGSLGWFDFLVHTELCTMNYDCLSLESSDRLHHMIRMMENFRVPQALRKSAREVVLFVYDVYKMMRDNSYHNFSHVTDVTQYMYTLLLVTHVADRLQPIEVCAAFIGALCHDLDHPGLSNAYLISTKAELSVKYNGDSPLEKHHLSVFERLAVKHGLLANVDVRPSLLLRADHESRDCFLFFLQRENRLSLIFLFFVLQNQRALRVVLNVLLRSIPPRSASAMS